MTPLLQFIAGVAFTLATLWFLHDAFKRKDFQDLHYDIIHFVCSLCAGAAGAFFTGSALLSFSANLSPGGTLAFQATAGVALFALVFLIFRLRFRSGKQPPVADGGWISPSAGASLQQIATVIAEEVGATIDLSRLSTEERKVQPRIERSLNCSTIELAKKALQLLQERAPTGTVRAYRVSYDGATKHFLLEI